MTRDATPDRPLPLIDELSVGFWEASARGELAIQRCQGCRRYQHPPQSVCAQCGGVHLEFEQVSGKARLFSWTTSHQRVLPGLDEHLPYLAFLVELVEQPGLLLASDLIGEAGPKPTLKIGRLMRVIFEPTADPAIVLPQFRFVGV